MAIGQEPGTFWSSFQTAMPETEISEKIIPGLIIENVMSDFGIPYNIDQGYFSSAHELAGRLDNVDLKRVDPISAIKASLLEVYAMSDTSGLVEMRVSEEGEVEVYAVGENNADIDVYYTVKSATHLSTNVGVQITGGKPKQQRIVYPWYSLIGKEATDYTIWNTTHLTSNCGIEKLSNSAVITYKNFLSESGRNTYNDGVIDIFELQSPHERIVGWAWRVIPGDPSLITSNTTIMQQSQSVVPILLGRDGVGILASDPDPGFRLGEFPVSPNIGTPVRRKSVSDYDSGDDDGLECAVFEVEDRGCTSNSLNISIPMREGLTYTDYRNTVVNKFKGISNVFVVGVSLTDCRGVPRPGTAGGTSGNTAENTELFISADDTAEPIFKLNPGVDYIISYGESEADPSVILPCIQFANNCRQNDHALFGTDVSFYVDIDAKELFKLFGGTTLEGGQTGLVGQGTVLPIKNDGSGILVKQVWLEVQLETPSFVVSDPKGNAMQIADGLAVEVTAIVVKSEPAPMAVNGELVDMDTAVPDNDPTTIQNFEETEYEKAMAKMSTGRTLSLNLASLNADQTVTLSRKLYGLLSENTGFVYSHTCAPTSDPKLGDKGPNGGIVNSISYSYNDQGSYLINVTEGPEYFGDMAGISGGFYYKQVEDIQAKGTIIQDYGNHVDYKIRVDGYGDMWAINGTPNVLDVRDRVSVTIHNNAVEG